MAVCSALSSAAILRRRLGRAAAAAATAHRARATLIGAAARSLADSRGVGLPQMDFAGRRGSGRWGARVGVRCNAQAAVRAGRGLTTALARPSLVTLHAVAPRTRTTGARRVERSVVGRRVRRLANDHFVDSSSRAKTPKHPHWQQSRQVASYAHSGRRRACGSENYSLIMGDDVQQQKSAPR